uniref:Uncharacterized protein n=1 Tax=Plectus sambesii TaxID=2011161 RepID=A0A914XUK4_9BILA
MLKVAPRIALFDTPVVISAGQLMPKQKITIQAYIDHASGKFESFARFVADDNGNINLTTAPSIGGSYEGIHPMALFTTLEQSPGQREGLLFAPRRAHQPVIYRFRMLNGHGEANRSDCITETLVERHFLHPAVERREIEIGRLRGTFFCLKGFTGKQPALIDITGTGGGLMEHRGALLASKGFAVLSLAYFAYKDLPNTMDQIDLNYFEEAIDWLSGLPNTSDQLGFVGKSLGGAIAVLAGIRYQKLKAIVPINGFHMLDSFNSLKENGIPLPSVSPNMSSENLTSGALRYADFLADIPTTEDRVFHIEDCASDIYWHFMASGDDGCCCSEKSARILEKRLIDAGKGRQVQVTILQNAGHILEPPFMPHSAKAWHKNAGAHVLWGGDKYCHAKGQEEMWVKLVAFLREKLGIPPVVPAFTAPAPKSLL